MLERSANFRNVLNDLNYLNNLNGAMPFRRKPIHPNRRPRRREASERWRYDVWAIKEICNDDEHRRAQADKPDAGGH